MTNSATNVKAALYLRLSRDDDLAGDSSSILTQRQMLQRYAKDNHFSVVDEYVDDGYSGTNFNRPSFQRMISDIDDGKVNCVIVKDMSRLGRNYLEVGKYTEMYFPANDVRFIAINNGIDSATQQDNDFTPFLNIINEWYAKDTSKKIKAALRTKFQEGVSFCTYAPFGYKKDPNDHTKLIIDEETAPIIRHIFDLALQGYGAGKIVKTLIAEQIPTPSWFNYSRYGTFAQFYRESEDRKCMWTHAQMKSILKNEVYIGTMVHNKQSTISFKNKKKKRKGVSEWIKVENTHEPIISRDDFCKVQEMIKSRRKTTESGEQQMFAGLIKCADCGLALKYATAKKKNGIRRYFNCSTYSQYGKESCSIHYINYNNLYNYVLSRLQHWSKLCEADEQEMLKYLIKDGEKNSADSYAERELKKAQKRLKELDGLLAKLYEDSLSEKITERNFDSLCAKFQTEQEQLDKRIIELTAEVNAKADRQQNIRNWVETIKKYSNPKELTAEMLNALIERIAVHEAETLENGEKRQKVDIYYRFIGKID